MSSYNSYCGEVANRTLQVDEKSCGGSDERNEVTGALQIDGKRTVAIMVLVGAIMFTGSCLAAGFQLRRQHIWMSTTGTIIRNEHCSSEDTHRPIIQYKVAEATYTTSSRVCSHPPRAVGNAVAVLYNPEDPSDAMDASFVGAWLFPVVFGVCGLLFIFLPLRDMQSASGSHSGQTAVCDTPRQTAMIQTQTIPLVDWPTRELHEYDRIPDSEYFQSDREVVATSKHSPAENPQSLEEMLAIDIPLVT